MTTLMTDAVALPLGSALEALMAELGMLQAELAAFRARLQAGPPASLSQKDVQLCEEALQWASIAMDMEMKRDAASKKGGARASATDLNAARDQIGGKLDRLRAAASADGVSK